jgi:hypothetical protein
MTKAEKIIKHLESKGCTKVPSRSIKYVVLAKPYGFRGGKYFYIGPKGSVRVGDTIGSSISVTSLFRNVK